VRRRSDRAVEWAQGGHPQARAAPGGAAQGRHSCREQHPVAIRWEAGRGGRLMYARASCTWLLSSVRRRRLQAARRARPRTGRRVYAHQLPGLSPLGDVRIPASGDSRPVGLVCGEESVGEGQVDPAHEVRVGGRIVPGVPWLSM
jgi:hypothetical protein